MWRLRNVAHDLEVTAKPFPTLLRMVRDLHHPLPHAKTMAFFNTVTSLKEANSLINIDTEATQTTKESTIDTDGKGTGHCAREIEPIPRECSRLCIKAVYMFAIVVEHDRALQDHVHKLQCRPSANGPRLCNSFS